jgi:hypothetical protein
MGMICQLGANIEDPKKRLETVFAESAKSKELWSPLKLLMPLVTETVALGSPIGIQMLALFNSRSNLANVLPPAVNVSISNVFGPKFTLYANGAELLHSYPVSIVTHGIGLNITLQSYRDHLDLYRRRQHLAQRPIVGRLVAGRADQTRSGLRPRRVAPELQVEPVWELAAALQRTAIRWLRRAPEEPDETCWLAPANAGGFRPPWLAPPRKPGAAPREFDAAPATPCRPSFSACHNL